MNFGLYFASKTNNHTPKTSLLGTTFLTTVFFLNLVTVMYWCYSLKKFLYKYVRALNTVVCVVYYIDSNYDTKILNVPKIYLEIFSKQGVLINLTII